MVRRYSRRSGLTGAEMAIASSIIAILIGLLVPNLDQLHTLGTQMQEQTKNENLRRLGLGALHYDSDMRRFPRQFQSIITDAVTTGKLDTESLTKLSLEIASSEDDMDMAKEVVQEVMQDKSLTKNERKLVQGAIPIYSQLKAELHVIRVLIGLLLPSSNDGGAAAAIDSAARPATAAGAAIAE